MSWIVLIALLPVYLMVLLIKVESHLWKIIWLGAAAALQLQLGDYAAVAVFVLVIVGVELKSLMPAVSN